MPIGKARATAILSEFEQAQTELVGKAVVLTDGKAGTVEKVWLDESHGLQNLDQVPRWEVAEGLAARRECNAELAGQLNCATDGNPSTAFGNVDDLTVTLGKAAEHHLRGKVALHAPLGSLLAFEKHHLGMPSNTSLKSKPDPHDLFLRAGHPRWVNEFPAAGRAIDDFRIAESTFSGVAFVLSDPPSARSRLW